MNREAFLRKLRKFARQNDLGALKVDRTKGKGSHYRVTLNGKTTTVQSGELTPFLVGRICEQLDVDPAAL